MRNKVVFASDFHLGIDAINTSKERELLIVQWLMEIKDELKSLYLVGDIFDYWYEYKSSIPSGFSDFLAALKILKNEGVEITLFTGNHDLWMFRYFTEEYGITVHKEGQILELDSKKLYLAHGDGLGPGDKSYKIIKAIFSNKICQWLFSIVHPTLGLGIMKRISQRDAHKYLRPNALDPKNEWLIQFAEEYNRSEEQKMDYFVFGHRHLMYDHKMDDGSRVLNLGDWINYLSYAEWDGKDLTLKQYKKI